MLVNPTFADAETYVRDILIVAGIALIFIEVRYLYGVAVTSLEAELAFASDGPQIAVSSQDSEVRR